jgi:signal peptidase
LFAAVPFLTIAITAGVAAVKGWQLRGMLTGSMEPSISRGSLVVITPAQHPVDVGAVVAFADPFDRRRILAHRVIEIVRSSAGNLNYRTKGDANQREDPRPIPDEEVIGHVAWRVPAVGAFMQRMRTPTGVGIAFGAPLVGLVVERALRRRPSPRHRVVVPVPRPPRRISEADVMAMPFALVIRW